MKRIFTLSSVVMLFFTLFIASTVYAKKDLYIKDSDFVDTGFFSDYSGILENGDVDWVQLKDGVRLGQYKKVIILPFSSSSSMAQSASLKREMPEMFVNTLSGIFQVEKSDQNIGPKDFEKIKSLPADAVIMGNILKIAERDAAKNFWVGFGAGNPKAELEFKIVDTKTGEEVLRIIHDERSQAGVMDAGADVVNSIAKYIKNHR
ncbi:MAG: DUF4410 domain-containing protein [Nitrospirota bacterium]